MEESTENIEGLITSFSRFLLLWNFPFFFFFHFWFDGGWFFELIVLFWCGTHRAKVSGPLMTLMMMKKNQDLNVSDNHIFPVSFFYFLLGYFQLSNIVLRR